MSKKVSEKMSKRRVLTKIYKYHKLSRIEKLSKIHRTYYTVFNVLKLVTQYLSNLLANLLNVIYAHSTFFALQAKYLMKNTYHTAQYRSSLI